MTKFKMDTHMHFDLYKDRNEVLNYIEESGSYTIAVTNLPDLYERYLHLNDGRKFVKCALGFHPELAQQYAYQIEKFDRYISTTRFVGEIGLDYSTKDSINRAIQDRIFSHIVQSCSREKNKVLTVHSRQAEKRTLELLKNLSACNVIMHWYSGSISVMDEALSRGYYFSINPQMLNSANGRKIIGNIPLDRVLFESDAPFTTGMRTTYSVEFQDRIYRYLCECAGVTEAEMSLRLRNNFKTLLTTYSTAVCR